MMRFIGVAATCVTLVLAGCAEYKAKKASFASAKARGPACEVASGMATSFGVYNSRLHASTALRHQVNEIRGEMIQGGLRRIRVTQPVFSCKPLSGAFNGMAHCKAAAQLCGQ
jgi:hypothetical protein